MGRGLGAAHTMIQVRTALRARALETNDPAQLLTRLDQHMRMFHPGEPATVWCGVLDPGPGVVRMASAGHPPPAVSRPGSAARFADVLPGVPVGVAYPKQERRSSRLTLGPGEVLCATSTG